MAAPRTPAPRPPPYPVTPDGRYAVVRGRLRRLANPHLAPEERERLVRELKRARADGRRARARRDRAAARDARQRVEDLRVALGECGPAWWGDAAPDYARCRASATPYREWYEALALQGAAGKRRTRYK